MPRWMRALVVVLPLALIAVLATAACEEEPPPASKPAQGSASGARISVDKENVDFGQVPLDKEVRAVFNVKNVGTDTLTLRDVKIRLVEGCWPPEPVVGATTIKAGQSTTILIATQMHKGMDGPHLFEVQVRSNDAQEPLKKLYVKGNFGG